MTQLVASAQAFIEKARRPGVLGLVGQKLERSCARDLKAYFNELKTKVEALHLEDRQWDAGTARHVVEAALMNVLRKQRETLTATLRVNLQTAYLASLKMNHMAEAEGDIAVQADVVTQDKLGEVARNAAQWAADQAAELVVGIDATTIDRLASVIEQGITEMRGAYGTGQLIRGELEDMSVTRSITIASTEMNRAMSAATLFKLDAIGVLYKQWIPSAEVCDICEENVAAGVIPMDDDFPSGDASPPAHPNCRCAVTGARAPDSEEQE